MGKIVSVQQYYNWVKQGIIKIPPYQRGLAWNKKKIPKLLISLIKYKIPPILVNRKTITTPNGIQQEIYQLVDGLQRTLAIMMILEDQIVLKFDKKEQVPKSVKQLINLIEGKKFSELPEDIKNAVLNASIILEETELEPEDLQYMYILINQRPTPLNTAEFMYSLYYNLLMELMKAISDSKSFITLWNKTYKGNINEYTRFKPLMFYIRLFLFTRYANDLANESETIHQLSKWIMDKVGDIVQYNTATDLMNKIVEHLIFKGLVEIHKQNLQDIVITKGAYKGNVYFDILAVIYNHILGKDSELKLRRAVLEKVIPNYTKEGKFLPKQLIQDIEGNKLMVGDVVDAQLDEKSKYLLSREFFLSIVNDPEFQRLRDIDKNIFKSPHINTRYAWLKHKVDNAQP